MALILLLWSMLSQIIISYKKLAMFLKLLSSLTKFESCTCRICPEEHLSLQNLSFSIFSSWLAASSVQSSLVYHSKLLLYTSLKIIYLRLLWRGQIGGRFEGIVALSRPCKLGNFLGSVLSSVLFLKYTQHKISVIYCFNSHHTYRYILRRVGIQIISWTLNL